jgi:hypothetical protein
MFNLLTKLMKGLRFNIFLFQSLDKILVGRSNNNEYCIEIIETIGFPKYVSIIEYIYLFSILQSKENRIILDRLNRNSMKTHLP